MYIINTAAGVPIYELDAATKAFLAVFNHLDRTMYYAIIGVSFALFLSYRLYKMQENIKIDSFFELYRLFPLFRLGKIGGFCVFVCG